MKKRIDELQLITTLNTEDLIPLQTLDGTRSIKLRQAINDTIKENYSFASVYDYGIKEGFDVNVEENTTNFQRMIDECKDKKIILFPAGNFVFNEVNLGEKANVIIHGVSNNFASLANKNIYNGTLKDTFTRIICNSNPGNTFFNHKACVLILENIGFYNLKKDETGRFVEQEAKTNILMQHTVDEKYTKNLGKGKVFCTNCGFFGWKVVFGSEYTFQHLEDEWNTGINRSDYAFIKQSCVVANRCRFTRNGIGVNQSVDGRIIDCSFNKNDYAIVHREHSGFTTISNCRLEWNNYNGIYAEKAHEINVSDCEFDCNGHAGLYAVENTNSNFNGIFRRNGAKIETSEDSKSDYEKNVHIYAAKNVDCNFIGCNTKVLPISDVGSAPQRPSNSTCFIENDGCIVSLNNFCGCTKSDKNDANKFENNVNCIIKDNIRLNNIE